MTMRRRPQKENIKAASFSVSEATEQRLHFIAEELFPRKNLSEVLAEVFQVVISKFLKSWETQKMHKFVSAISLLELSRKEKRGWKKVIEEGLKENGKPFLDLIEELHLEYEDVRNFVSECQSVVKKNKDISDDSHIKKVKTFNLSSSTEKHINQLKLILGENKSDLFQFAVLTFYYLMVPASKVREAKRLYELYEEMELKLNELSNLASEKIDEIHELIYPDGDMNAVCERSVANINLVSIENEIIERKVDIVIRMNELEPIIKQNESAD